MVDNTVDVALAKMGIAIKEIKSGRFNRVEVDSDTKVYKVPSNNPNKYTIRIDIKVQKED